MSLDVHRFSPEEKQQRNPYCYLPFGTGPRNCIGMRFALLEAKMALACILKRFKFERSADTQVSVLYILKNLLPLMCNANVQLWKCVFFEMGKLVLPDPAVVQIHS